MAMFEPAMTALHGWHRGELAIQDLLGHKSHVQFGYAAVRDHLPDQHRIFHTSNIAFLPLTTLDSDGRPWVSLVASNKGTVGFVSSPSEVELVIEADIWKGDPITSNLQPGNKAQGKALIAGLGIEWATRRRNKFAGLVKDATLEDGRLTLELDITQTLGNCPKYINVRSVGPAATSPQVAFERPKLETDERLPNDVIEFIQKADTIFIGSTYVAEPSQQEMYPSHVGTNQRGGRSGFVRVRNDGLTLVVPDYSGNRFMNSLGNIQATPLGALTILDFETGDVLYVTGLARNVIGNEAQNIMVRTNVVTLIMATGYSFVRNAMPVRQLPGSKVYPSPYSPPVRYLVEEKPSSSSTSDTKLTLERIQPHSSDLATFYFSPSTPVSVRPGQAAIIDMNSFVGARGYQHMAQNGDESSLNDDGIRTWTVSGQTETGTLMITMREKPGGFVTSRLFSMVRKMEQVMPGLLEDARPVGLVVQLMGVDGEFVLPKAADGESPSRLLWVAGGVGITPFLSMLRGALQEGGNWDIVLAIAARRGDVEVLGRLMADILRTTPSPSAIPLSLALQIIVYSTGFNETTTPDFGTLPDGSPARVQIRGKRLSQGDLASSELDIVGRNVYVCGPLAMEELVLQGAKEAGIDPKSVHRENFAY